MERWEEKILGREKENRRGESRTVEDRKMKRRGRWEP